MQEQTQPVGNRGTAPREMGGVAVATLLGAFLIAAVFAFVAFRFQQGPLENGFIGGFATLLLWPHGVILWRILRGNRKPAMELGIQTGTAMAMVAALSCLALLLLLQLEEPGLSGSDLRGLALACTAPVAIAVVHYLLRRGARRHRAEWPESPQPWTGGVLLGIYFSVVLFVAMVTIPNLIRASISDNEVSAVDSLRTIHSALKKYQQTYTQRYPPSLSFLGEPESGGTDCTDAGLLEARLIAGRAKGYVFNYQPGPIFGPDIGTCPFGADTFSVTATPEIVGTTGTRSFYIDQTGTIRFTPENRAAESTDLPLR